MLTYKVFMMQKHSLAQLFLHIPQEENPGAFHFNQSLFSRGDDE
jgi:hypothetical protein